MSSFPLVQDSISAAGSNQATALALKLVNYARITTCTSGQGVMLPANAPPAWAITVNNQGASGLTVYPQVGGTLNTLAQNAGILIPPNQSLDFKTPDGYLWYTTSINQSTGKNMVSLGATATILPSQAGSVWRLDQSAAFTITLPSVGVTGAQYDFWIETSAANAITISAPTAVFNGTLSIDIAAGSVAVLASNHTNIVFSASNLKGSHLKVIDMGTWYGVEGHSKIVSGFTVS